MCGRVYMAPADPELRELVKEMNRSVLAERFRKEKNEILDAAGEICPSSIMPVFANNRVGVKRIYPMRWGFSCNKKLIINARVETARRLPTFSESWMKHRCAIPITKYFEWEHDGKKRAGQKYALQPENGASILLAGLYRMENGLPVFAVLTRPADSSISWMHDRMPVILRQADADRWIGQQTDPDTVMHNCVTRLAWEKVL